MSALLLLAAVALAEPTDRSQPHDPFDLGAGLAIGVTSGVKVRAVATPDVGLVLGVDLDIGTILFWSDATASAVLGWAITGGGHTLRAYLIAGGGFGHVALNFDSGPWRTVLRGGGGVEYKPGQAFGLGLEGGATPLISSYDTQTVPYGRIVGTLYLP